MMISDLLSINFSPCCSPHLPQTILGTTTNFLKGLPVSLATLDCHLSLSLKTAPKPLMTSTSLNQSHTFPVLVCLNFSFLLAFTVTHFFETLSFGWAFSIHSFYPEVTDRSLWSETQALPPCPGQHLRPCAESRSVVPHQQVQGAGNLVPAACEGPSPLLGRSSSLLWPLISQQSCYPPQKGPSAQCSSANGISCVEEQRNWTLGAPLCSPGSPIARGRGCSTGLWSAGGGGLWEQRQAQLLQVMGLTGLIAILR